MKYDLIRQPRMLSQFHVCKNLGTEKLSNNAYDHTPGEVYRQYLSETERGLYHSIFLKEV